jgi:uncharacterized UBP type Zn finger protein
MKNKAPVHISESLRLDPYLVATADSPTKGAKPSEYKVQSIVHHLGSRASSGHYTADALRYLKDDTGKLQPTWVTFDDSSSCLTSLERIAGNKRKQETAYMLLYTMDNKGRATN